jgi:hypothetical protein
MSETQLEEPSEKSNRLSLDTIFTILAKSRRRQILQSLTATTSPLAVADLTKEIARRESNAPHSEISDRVYDEIHTNLVHNHLPKLYESDLLVHDQQQNIVRLTPKSDELLLFLDALIQTSAHSSE